MKYIKRFNEDKSDDYIDMIEGNIRDILINITDNHGSIEFKNFPIVNYRDQITFSFSGCSVYQSDIIEDIERVHRFLESEGFSVNESQISYGSFTREIFKEINGIITVDKSNLNYIFSGSKSKPEKLKIVFVYDKYV